MAYRVFVTDRAREELDQACAWWAAKRSGEQALRWYNGFVRAIRLLSNKPERCPRAAEDYQST